MTSLAECLDKAGEAMSAEAGKLRGHAEKHRQLNSGNVPHSVEFDQQADAAHNRAKELWFLRDFIASGGMDVLRKLYDFDQAARGYYRAVYDGIAGVESHGCDLAYKAYRNAEDAAEDAMRGWARRHADEFKLLRDAPCGG